MPSYPFLDHDGVIGMAHRGGVGGVIGTGASENSMAAFARALDLGLQYFETDVRTTADGHLVLLHDPRLDRVSDATGRVDRTTRQQLSSVRLRDGGSVPLLEDVLGTWPDVKINIDVKCSSAVPALAWVMTRTGALDRVCVASFSHRRLASARRLLGPGLCTAASPVEVAALVTTGRTAGRAACLQLPARVPGRDLVTDRLISSAGRLGLPVHVWTVNDPAEMARLIAMGVRGLVSDDLLALQAALRRPAV